MKNKKLFIFSLVFVAVFVLFSLAIRTDYNLAKANKPPKFALKINSYKDGGTMVYIGIGYRVIDYNEMTGRKDVVFIPFYQKH